MSDNFYDREYNAGARVPNHAEYFARWKEAAASARRHPDARLDVAYGPSESETLDFFPAQVDNAPLLVFVHGGYWRAFHKDDFAWVADAYVKAGISVAVVNYALAPQVSISDIVNQVRRSNCLAVPERVGTEYQR